MRVMRNERGGAGAVALMVIVGLIIGGGLAAGAYFLFFQSDESDVAIDQPATTLSPTPEDTTVQEFPTERPTAPAAEDAFSEDMVEERIVNEGEDTRTLSVYFVSDAIDQSPLIAVQACVDEFSKPRFDTVSCYGFHSEEAFDAAGLDTETGHLDKLCWTAFLSQRSDGTGSGRHSNPEYEAQGCPPKETA